MRFFTLRMLIVFFAATFVFYGSTAQVGTLDTAYYKTRGYDFKCTGGLVLPDSTLIVTGRFFYANNNPIGGIAHVYTDGSIDRTFNTGTGADEHVNVVVRQPDGKLVIGGDFIQYDGVVKNRIARLNPDGSLDPSFNTGSGFGSSVYEIYILPNGKFLVGGNFTTFDGNPVGGFVRLNSDGTIDNTFSIGAGANNNVYDVDVQSDGKIIVAGQFTVFNTDTVGRILRLNADGTRDTTFKTLFGGANNIITSAYLSAGNKIVIGGFFGTYDGNSSSGIARLNTDGSYDATFTVGTGFNNNVNELALQPDGKVLVTGNFTNYAGTAISRIARLNTDGTRDLTFDPGLGLNLSCNTVFVHPDNSILVGGTFTTADSFARVRFVRLSTDGKVDQTFNRQSNLSALVNVLGKQSSGKLIVGGGYFKFNEVTRGRIARLNEDGSLDLTFATGVGANNQITALVVLPDDKILIAGQFTTFNGTSINRIARLNADGTLDNTFIPGTGFDNAVNVLAVDTLGRIYAGGQFTAFNGTTINRIIRLTANGAIDNTFAVGTGCNNTVWDLVVDKSNKLLASGAFTTYNGTTVNRLVRVNTDGTIDNTFTMGTGANNIVYCIELLANGSMYIGGQFTTYNGTTKNRIARLNANGTLDATYTASANNSFVKDIAVMNEGVIAVGSFTQFNGVASNRIAFTDTSGNASSYFTVGNGTDGAINTVRYDYNARRVFLGGGFTGVQTSVRTYLAALRTSFIDLTDAPQQLCQGATTNIYFRKAKVFAAFNNMVVQLSDSNGNFANAINIGVKNSAALGNDSVSITIPFSVPTGGNYRMRIVSTTPADTSNISRAIHIGPLGNLSITPSGPTTFCSGGTVTLTSPASSSYVWSNGATTQSITVSSSGTFNVSVTVNGCPGFSNSVAVTVNSSPDSSLAIASYSLCGNSATLTAAPGYSYQWSSGGTGQTETVTTDGSYTVTITSSGGCVADSTLTVNFAAINNNLILANGTSTICQGQAVQLQGLYGLSYTWSTGVTASTITVNNAGNYSATASDGTCSISTNTISVIVNPLPTATISTSGPDKLCIGGGSVQLQVPSANSYLWNTTQTSQSISATTAGQYTVTVTSADGCSASGTYSVTVFAPAVSVTPNGNTTLCDGENVQLSATGGGNYLWSNGATTATVTVNTSGAYSVTVTDPTSSCTVGSSNSISVSVNPLPNVSFALSTDTICANGGVLVLAGGTPAGGTYSGSGVSGGSFNPTGLSGNVVITYSVTDANSCTANAADNIYVDVCAGMQSVNSLKLLVYPNPVENLLHIQAEFWFDKITVYDLAGKLVRVVVCNTTQELLLDVADLSAGTYLLKMQDAYTKFSK